MGPELLRFPSDSPKRKRLAHLPSHSRTAPPLVAPSLLRFYRPGPRRFAMRGRAFVSFVARRPQQLGFWTTTCALLTLVSVLGPALRADALPAPPNCQVDPRGANDRPGQRDVTTFCVDRGDGAPWELHTSINLDETRVSGANTIDACALLNTDGRRLRESRPLRDDARRQRRSYRAGIAAAFHLR